MIKRFKRSLAEWLRRWANKLAPYDANVVIHMHSLVRYEVQQKIPYYELEGLRNRPRAFSLRHLASLSNEERLSAARSFRPQVMEQAVRELSAFIEVADDPRERVLTYRGEFWVKETAAKNEETNIQY